MEIMDLIDTLEDEIESGGRVPLTGKRTVDTSRVADIVDRMRAAVPEEIRSARQIRSRSEGIVTEAVVAARQIKASAEKDRQASLEESAIIQAAQDRAKVIVAEAGEEAERIRKRGDQTAASRIQEANAYAEASLGKLGKHMSVVRSETASLESAIGAIEKSIDLGTRVLQVGRTRGEFDAKNGEAKNGAKKNGTNGTKGAVAEPLESGDLKVDGLVATPLDGAGSDDIGPIDVEAIVAAAEEKVSKRRR